MPQVVWVNYMYYEEVWNGDMSGIGFFDGACSLSSVYFASVPSWLFGLITGVGTFKPYW